MWQRAGPARQARRQARGPGRTPHAYGVLRGVVAVRQVGGRAFCRPGGRRGGGQADAQQAEALMSSLGVRWPRHGRRRRPRRLTWPTGKRTTLACDPAGGSPAANDGRISAARNGNTISGQDVPGGAHERDGHLWVVVTEAALPGARSGAGRGDPGARGQAPGLGIPARAVRRRGWGSRRAGPGTGPGDPGAGGQAQGLVIPARVVRLARSAAARPEIQPS